MTVCSVARQALVRLCQVSFLFLCFFVHTVSCVASGVFFSWKNDSFWLFLFGFCWVFFFLTFKSVKFIIMFLLSVSCGLTFTSCFILPLLSTSWFTAWLPPFVWLSPASRYQPWLVSPVLPYPHVKIVLFLLWLVVVVSISKISFVLSCHAFEFEFLVDLRCSNCAKWSFWGFFVVCFFSDYKMVTVCM